ncbi:MAG: DUF5666 domain-containing protein, partial [Terracidiphilus sp.]
MKARRLTPVLLGLALAAAFTVAAFAQDASPSPQAPGSGSENGGWQQGHRGGRGGGMMGGMMGGGQALMGTVTTVAPDHYTVRTETGEVYTVYFSANTRILKQRVRRRQAGSRRDSNSAPGPGDPESGGPQFLKASDIKVGDVIAAGGQLDASAKTLGAVFVLQLDPERARQMQQMEASYGKTWLMGRVTAVDGVKVTLEGIRDKTAYNFAADENTTFRHRRDPITLADIHVGDLIRVEGGLKDGVFLATAVNDVGSQPEARTPRNRPPAGSAPNGPPPDNQPPGPPPQP